MNHQTASHFVATMNLHYAVADFFAKEFERKRDQKLLASAVYAVELAEAARVKARELGAKV